MRRLSPDTFDNSSDEDDSDPLRSLPFDTEYIKYVIMNPGYVFDREAIKFWEDEAKAHRFNKYDE